MKKNHFYFLFLLLQIITNISPFCLYSNTYNFFPKLYDSEQFYLKKVTDDCYIVGTEKEAIAFSLPILDGTTLTTSILKKMINPYVVYADPYGNMDPIIVGINSVDNLNYIKYILSEGMTSGNEFNNAIYDISKGELREGKLSFGFPDFKILAPLNDKEYIGAVKLYYSESNMYSIKLQVMSFSQTSKGFIKQLSGKEYALTDDADQNVNDILYINTSKKILIIRTINNEIYFDFIDYDIFFGTLQISKKITAPFNVKEYRFKSVVLYKEDKKTYIATCFRKFNYLYCYSGYFDDEKVEFVILQDNPKLLLSTCSDKIFKNIALYKLSSGTGIVGCSGSPYYTIRFDKNLNTIGSPIKFPMPSTEFVVANENTLFVMYSKEHTTDDLNKYDLYGCLYYLPICNSATKIFLKQGNEFDFKNLLNNEDELKNMENIYIKTIPNNAAYKIYTQNSGTKTPITSNEQVISNLYYSNIDATSLSSFEETIYYYTYVSNNPAIAGDEEARSPECVLSIVNCYKSCEVCDDIGTDNNNNCLQCNEDENYFFIENGNTKQCLLNDNSPIEKYFFDSENSVFKRCYMSCKKCNKQEDLNQNKHNCIECDTNNRFYPYNPSYTYSDNPTLNLYNCFLDTQPPIGHYFDKEQTDGFYFKLCSNEGLTNCANCVKNSDSTLSCKRCNLGYYALFSDEEKTNAECTQTAPPGYYIDENAGECKKCYPTCETCSGGGTDEFNNCDTCLPDYNVYDIDSSTCRCEYNFYYKRDIVTNHKIFTCSEDQNCPNEADNEYPYLIINSQNIRQCVERCPYDYPYTYNNQCYNHIPNGTTLIDDLTKTCEDSNFAYDQCIINDYIESTISLNDIPKVEQEYVNNYRTQYANQNTDLTYNHANMIRNSDDEYYLLIFENEKCIEKIRSEYGLGYTDLTDYSPKIRSQNGIDKNEPLIYSFLYTYNIPYNSTTPVENIDYSCYDKNGRELNLEDALEGENITQYVSPPTGQDLQKLNYLSKYSNLGIDFSYPNSDFFNSQCFVFTSDNGKDVTLADRRKYFFNKIKICDDNCVFSGIDESKNTAKCTCPYKSKSSGGGKKIKNVTFPNYKEDYFIFDMWKCLSKKMVEGKELKKSYITIIVFIILLLTILFTVLFFYCSRNRFQFLSKFTSQYSSSSVSKSSQSYSQKNIAQNQQKNNPPPKKEGGEDNDSNSKKEKGYVHDVKRPFNYDNNNLFFHADEHYTIGNNNLNSLFMGQNFKNDYSDKIDLIDNNEKKPKQPINNYNTINVQGKRINKNIIEKYPKVNNYNNINIGPDIININKKNQIPTETNKEKKKRNNPITIIKDSSDVDSVDNLNYDKPPIKGKISNFNKKNKVKPEDNSSEKSYTNYSNKKSLISNKNNSLNGKAPSIEENEKDKEIKFNDDVKSVINEFGEVDMKINKADYNTAKETDFRDFCSFYFNQIKHRQIFLYTGYFHKYAENIFMKIMIIIFHILLCLFLNLFWYRTYYVHSEFISPITNHSTFSSKYAWFRILLSVLFYIIIVSLLHLIYLPQLNIYYSLSNDKLDKNQKIEIMEKNIKWMKINYIIFVVINFCFLIVLLLYVLVFSYVFQNSKTDLMISFILTVILTQALPFLFVLFVTIFRFIGLKYNKPWCYKLSLFFTI